MQQERRASIISVITIAIIAFVLIVSGVFNLLEEDEPTTFNILAFLGGGILLFPIVGICCCMWIPKLFKSDEKKLLTIRLTGTIAIGIVALVLIIVGFIKITSEEDMAGFLLLLPGLFLALPNIYIWGLDEESK